MSNQIFVVEEYTPACTCPVCGGKMTPAEYYVAHKGKTTWSEDRRSLPGNQVLITYKTPYSNIRRKTGGLCTACLVKEKQETAKKHWPFAIGLGAAALCGLMILLLLVCALVTRNNDFVEKYWFLFAIAFFGTPVSGYFAWDHFKTAWYHSKNCKQILAQGVSEDDLSFYFVFHGQRALFGGGETLLDRQDVKRMKSL